LDNKSLERTISSLEAEIVVLRKDLKEQKEKTALAQKEGRGVCQKIIIIGDLLRDDMLIILIDLIEF
jgi:hypothetical protein